MFGSLAVASMLVMGGVSCANAIELSDLTDGVPFKDGTATVNPTREKYAAGKQVVKGNDSLDSISITLTDQIFEGELNAGSLAFGDGVTATVKNASITTTGGKVRVGVALNGGGKSETRGTTTSTENSYNFGGINTRIMDSTSWAGMVGLQAEKGNLSLGLNYGVQASSHETDQGVRFTLGWKF